MQSERLRPYFLILFLLGALVLTGFIFAPFLNPLALAAVFAVVLQGLYKNVSKYFRWPGVAASATILISTIVILIPLSLVSILIGQEARDLYLSLEKLDGESAAARLFDRADGILNNLAPGLQDVSVDIDASAKTALNWIVGRAGSVFGSISSFLLSLFIFFVALYYLLREGPRVRGALIELSPLSDNEDEAIFDRLERAVNSVIKGNLMIALIQGALAMLGFTIFGVPHAILWGAVTAVAALIPGVGTALVFAPVIAFLFFTGDIFSAIALLIWGALAVGLIDNLLGPRLIGRGMQLHPLLVLLSVLGGLIFFGASGIFLGPLSLSLFFSLLSLYRQSSKRAS